MNEFSAKKLGEVLAFAIVGIETFERGRHALEQGLGAHEYTRMRLAFEKQKMQLESIAKESNVLDIVNKKVEGTGKKLRAMRDLYIDEEWDNFTELLEWHGFFEGAAIIHWELVIGVANTLNHASLTTLAKEALTFHNGFLNKDASLIREVGLKKSGL